ncbi:MAG: hypothetical protein AAB131_03430, partial [Actinomycetota bacterium]
MQRALSTSINAAPAIAIVFPGQGAQRPGMARDFHEASAVAREVFAEASEALNLDVGALCFEDDPRLDLVRFVCTFFAYG